MTKKQKDFFKYLQTLPELQEKRCKKAVRQLQTYISKVEFEWPYVDDVIFNRITKKVFLLQDKITDSTIVSELRKYQSYSDKKRNSQGYEQQSDFNNFYDTSVGWCGVDYEC